MADAVATQTLLDGERVALMKFTDISDGTGESAVTKVDVSALAASASGKTCTGVKLNRIWFSTFGMGVDILWVATANVLAWHLNENESFCLDFSEFPIKNNSGTGKTGDIAFTTIGHTAADRYTVMLELLKEYA